MSKRELTTSEQSLCANPANLPALKQRWDRALHSDFADRDDAYLLLSTAIWWHRDKLITAYARSGLRLVA